MYIKVLGYAVLDIIGQTLQIICIHNYETAKLLRKLMIILLSMKWSLFGYIMICLAYMFFEINWSSANVRAIAKNGSIPDELLRIKKYLHVIYLILYPGPFGSFIIAGLLDVSYPNMKLIVQATIILGTGIFELVVFTFIIVNISKLINIFEKHVNTTQNQNHTIEQFINRSKKAQKIYFLLMICTLPSVFSWILPMIVNMSSTILNFYSLCGLCFCLVILHFILTK